MKVTFFTRRIDKSDARSGAIHDWAAKLAERVEWLYVICLEKGKTDLPANAEVFVLGKGKVRRIFNFLRKGPKVIWKSDAIFCHMYPVYTIMCAPFTKLFRKRLVTWHAHATVTIKLKIAHALTDEIVTSTPNAFKIRSKKVKVVGQGINTDYFAPPKKTNNKYVLLAVGRITQVKKYETLIKAASILVKHGIKNLEFRIVGGTVYPKDEIYLKELKKLIEKLGVSKNVKFIGPVPHEKLASQYQDCEIFVSSTPTGSFDKAVLEAMACARPIVTCNDSFGEIGVRHLFKEGDAEDMADKIKLLFSMPPVERNKLGLGYREIIKKDHNMESLMDKIVEELKK
ncbi:MAG: glycosyltransferase family 4 protein [Candidatus Altiarchaeota archaeon]|nr:glycosyltransferase family 4 protein [Candidatus Altiarchaeota archaeon]